MARARLPNVASQLIEDQPALYARGWVLGTSGNFSVVVARDTAAARDHGQLAFTRARSAAGHPCRATSMARSCRPGLGQLAGAASPHRAETLLHVEIARSVVMRGAIAPHALGVDARCCRTCTCTQADFSIDGYEMLKGLRRASRRTSTASGFPSWTTTRTCRGWRSACGAILERVTRTSTRSCTRRHGLYTWGDTLADAGRHIEILEFLVRNRRTDGRAEAVGSGRSGRAVGRSDSQVHGRAGGMRMLGVGTEAP